MFPIVTRHFYLKGCIEMQSSPICAADLHFRTGGVPVCYDSFIPMCSESMGFGHCRKLLFTLVNIKLQQ